MKYINTANTREDILIVVEVPTHELVKDSLQSVFLSRLPEQYQNKVLFSDFVDYHKFSKVKDLPNVKLVISPDTKWVDTGIYFIKHRYDSAALFLSNELEQLERCVLYATHYLEHGEPLITQKDRIGFYPKNQAEVEQVFNWLHSYPVLGADIETTSLKFYKAELVSISFAVSETKGITLHVRNCDFIAAMVEFFKSYQGRIVWHNGAYDVKVLAYLYFGSDSRELYRTFEDTKFLHFMCTNSPERPSRGLGELGKDLCGDYKLTKQEITNMMAVDKSKVCSYNLDDARATYWLYRIYRTKIYSEYFYSKMKRWQWALTQMELTGVPYRVADLDATRSTVNAKLSELTQALTVHPYVVKALELIQMKVLIKYNETHVKQKELKDLKAISFNPNSPVHVKTLFEQVIQVESPIKTASGQPSYGTKSYPHLKLAIGKQPLALEIMELLEEYSGYNQLNVTFLKPMLGNSHVKSDGTATLHGTYNLGLVVSGRLSSSEPNLQNLPSKGALGKIFKSLITPPVGKMMGASDYALTQWRM